MNGSLKARDHVTSYKKNCNSSIPYHQGPTTSTLTDIPKHSEELSKAIEGTARTMQKSTPGSGSVKAHIHT